MTRARAALLWIVCIGAGCHTSATDGGLSNLPCGRGCPSGELCVDGGCVTSCPGGSAPCIDPSGLPYCTTLSGDSAELRQLRPRLRQRRDLRRRRMLASAHLSGRRVPLRKRRDLACRDLQSDRSAWCVRHPVYRLAGLAMADSARLPPAVRMGFRSAPQLPARPPARTCKRTSTTAAAAGSPAASSAPAPAAPAAVAAAEPLAPRTGARSASICRPI